MKCFLRHRGKIGEYLFMRKLNHKKMLFCDQKWSNISNFRGTNVIKRVYNQIGHPEYY